ncbi:c6 zinc finger domain containing protein [Niveomyces insectorum RCEF 264]|uniref:C6 zinc finger domain containing protein n=1 Tax=Niveomyces insectorum RCEF 264 TaxID=1081102 RepID=A0A167W3M0_9HYPO|nr:c6 zinc finger domain containing protein [Niveomyces insectorum RCEF 264]
MRRQNHSCDQCRKAKRACDAPSLRETAAAGRTSVAGSCRSEAGHGGVVVHDLDYMLPCSYCVKTNKRCTLNWARSQLQSAEAVSGPRAREHRRTKRQRIDDNHSVFADPASARDRPPTSILPLPLASGSGHATTSASAPVSAHGLVPAAVPASAPAPAPAPAPASAPTPAPALPVHMPFWDPAQPSFESVPDYYGFSAAPSTQGDFVLHTGSSLLGFDQTSVAEPRTGFVSLPYSDAPLPAATVGLVSRPAFYNLAADQPAIWGAPTNSVSAPDMDPATNGARGVIDLSSSPQAFSAACDEKPDVSSIAAVANGSASSSSSSSSSSSVHPFTFSQYHRQYAAAHQIASFSPSHAEYLMVTRVNNQSISENLLQIYHDVLEHNFTCWMAEETCPYNVWARPPPMQKTPARREQQPLAAALEGRRRWTPKPHYKQQFGPHWSNRIYRRVINLDRAAQAAGILRLTPAQNQASQKAFHLVIMAFATQWAQGSQRQRESYASGFTHQATTEEFDRSIQRALWQQARQALHDCADIESYRVVCAEVIFGMTQRPWEEDEFADLSVFFNNLGRPAFQSEDGDSTARQAAAHFGKRPRELILSKLNEILEKDGPPTFFERAARRIHTLKVDFDNHELGLLGSKRGGEPDVQRPNSDAPGTAPSSLSPEEGQTVGLLFWLAVMFDTISSSLTERPVVLADEESQHEAAEHDRMFPQENDVASFRAMSRSSATAANSHDDNDNDDDDDDDDDDDNDRSLGSSNRQITHVPGSGPPARRSHDSTRWRIDLFIQDDPERAAAKVHYRWPCSYDEAARVLTRSAPVKILLFRHVFYLQNTLRKPYLHRGQPVEETIYNALLVYRYWNTTYDPFYRDLVVQYAAVPARLRGWFVCIGAHWHLAALLLADAIELIDEYGVGRGDGRAQRASANTVAHIRAASAAQLADLARVATPLGVATGALGVTGAADAAAAPQMPDFHFAVREGTVLTEPWTKLLIRAFSKAALLHLQDLDTLRPQQPTRDAYRNSMRQCEECIQALWYLGKKSDMARNVAALLSRAMNV